MKIAFLISALDGGGAAKIVGNISSHLPEDWEIDIILNNSERIAFAYRGNIVSLQIPEPKKRTNYLYQWKTFRKRVKFLRTIKKERGYDCCISYMDSANVANLLTNKNDCKVILNVVNNMTATAKYSATYRWIVNPLIKLFYNKADRVIALSNDVSEDMIRSYGLHREIMRVSYCSVDIKELDREMASFQELSNQEWFDKKKTVVTAGRMEEQKGQWHLIRAFSKVVKSDSDAKLVIFGDGSLRGYMEELIKEYGMQENVLLFGFDKHMPAYIARSAIFAFPSLYEGFGTALQEALACDVACIATDYEYGAREQLDPEFKGKVSGYRKGRYGILTEACSEKMPDASAPLDSCENSLAEAILELLSDDDLRTEYAKKARERSFVFDIDGVAKAWIRDIREAVGENENK